MRSVAIGFVNNRQRLPEQQRTIIGGGGSPRASGGRGIDIEELARKDRVLFAVRSLELDYRQPARLSDALRVSVVLERARRASLELWQEVIREDQPLCAGRLRLACLDADTLRPRRIPDNILTEL